ncbi:transposase [Pelomonas sp. Root1217]|uniref:IS66-like element accessory protein TnpA n=1 Tax=Pelomonas sp. Root1217 TaxID=1736430 RepID=UPI00070B8B09|nr:transposase [Pelomonas sp. Root1217]
MSTSNFDIDKPATPAGRSWRRHSAEFKARVIELARQPGVSTAAVALANGLNANMLRRWVREADECVLSSAHKDAAAVPAFVQLPMPQEVPASLAPAPAQVHSCISVEIRRGGATVHAELPMDARSAAWLREVLG